MRKILKNPKRQIKSKIRKGKIRKTRKKKIKVNRKVKQMGKNYLKIEKESIYFLFLKYLGIKDKKSKKKRRRRRKRRNRR